MNAYTAPIRWDIIDGNTGCRVGEAKTSKGARRSADKRDMAYGSVRYIVRPIYAPTTETDTSNVVVFSR